MTVEGPGTLHVVGLGPEGREIATRAEAGGGQCASDALLEIRDLSVEYGGGSASIVAVDEFNLAVRRGEVVGIVGESGSGKSTLAYAMMRLLREPGHVRSGQITYHKRGGGGAAELLSMESGQLRALRWAELAIVFQSAMNALNPVLTLQAQIEDVLRAHDPALGRSARRERVIELLRLVGIPSSRRRAFPHELSGGMRQRGLIAIALALSPDLLILDEPTTALDVVTQRQILDEVLRLRAELGFSVIFITHDLALIMGIADRIVVMYAGRTVESGTAAEILHAPRHPYTSGLLNSFPTLSGPKRRLTGIVGSPPNLAELPSGCPFHTRCERVMPVCQEKVPIITPTGVPGDGPERRVRCWLYGAVRAVGGPSGGGARAE
jgi:peptide/nickel transport system ATP-binding protein